MAGTGAIFRVTSTGDTESSVASTEKIEFNGGSAPDTTGKLTATGFDTIRDLSFHPNPRRALTKIQDNLLGTLEVTITGHFVDHDSTIGPLNFFNWSKDPATNDDFPFGRFGLRLDDFGGGALSLTPSATIGYILHIVHVEDAESPRDIASFVAKLYRNGSI